MCMDVSFESILRKAYLLGGWVLRVKRPYLTICQSYEDERVIRLHEMCLIVLSSPQWLCRVARYSALQRSRSLPQRGRCEFNTSSCRLPLGFDVRQWIPVSTGTLWMVVGTTRFPTNIMLSDGCNSLFCWTPSEEFTLCLYNIMGDSTLGLMLNLAQLTRLVHIYSHQWITKALKE